MNIDITLLSDEERQRLADQLHLAKVYPSRLVGMGTPAHVEAINANLNDLRQTIAMQSQNTLRFYEIVAPKVAGPAQRPAQEEPLKQPEKDNEKKP